MYAACSQLLIYKTLIVVYFVLFVHINKRQNYMICTSSIFPKIWMSYLADILINLHWLKERWFSLIQFVVVRSDDRLRRRVSDALAHYTQKGVMYVLVGLLYLEKGDVCSRNCYQGSWKRADSRGIFRISILVQNPKNSLQPSGLCKQKQISALSEFLVAYSSPDLMVWLGMAKTCSLWISCGCTQTTIKKTWPDCKFGK